MRSSIAQVRLRRLGLSVALIILPLAAAFTAQPPPLPQIPGYRSVQMSLRTVNQMETTVFVNGKPEQFGVDTGASTTVMNEHDAMKDGATPTQSDSPYGQYAYAMGQRLRIAIADLSAGSMNFGRGPIALYSKGRSDLFFIERSEASRRMAGLLGADILLHYKTIINCRNRQMFFPTSARPGSKLGTVVAEMGFTRIPLREENSRALTVPCTLGGKSGRLLIDTGAFNTFLDAALIAELRMPTQQTQMVFSDFRGQRNGASLARVTNLQIGAYHLPAQKLFVLGSSLSADISRIAETHIFGVLGADLLTLQHGIIDLESMSLFLK